MKLVYPDYSFQLVFKENIINTLIIENHSYFASIVNELDNQCKGYEGRFMLSDKIDIYNIASSVNIIINPFDLNLNEKKVLTKLYKLMDIQINDSMLMDEFIEIKSDIFSIIEKLSIEIDVPLSLEYNENIILFDLLKMVNVKLEVTNESLIEKIIDYIKVNHIYLEIKLFVFVNLKLYLSEEDINNLCKFVIYNKINILFLEASKVNINLSNEVVYIIDEDLCEIFNERS